MRDAIGMAERALARFRATVRATDTEKVLHDRMEMLVREEGGRCGSFPAIIGVGPRAALPHCPPSDRRVGEDDLVLVDWGAKGAFYNSDLTRTFATRKVSAKFAEVYRAVLAAQQAAINMIRPGAVGQDIDAEARRVLDRAGLGAYFNHGLGHGLGLEVHEAPALRPGSTTALAPGMIVTVEPGVYLPEWGGVRIEDDVLVTPDGHEVLTRAPKELDQAVLAL
jgi:Xaa-Pro aminopeptidase